MPQEMVIFSRSFDLLTWLLPAADKFPKAQRFVVTQRLTGAALDMQEALFHANARRRGERLACLRDADAHLGSTVVPSSGVPLEVVVVGTARTRQQDGRGDWSAVGRLASANRWRGR